MYDPQKVLDMMTQFVQEIALGKSVDSVHYREDYQDYMIILDEHYHCELREKLIDTLFKERNADLVREIVFRLKNAAKFEDWEDNPTDQRPPEEGPQVDLTGL